MPSNWSKGFTKNTHPSVFKISETMRRKKIDNFSVWRERAKSLGIIPSNYPDFKKDGDLAECALAGLGAGLATTTAGAIENIGNALFGDAAGDLVMLLRMKNSSISC